MQITVIDAPMGAGKTSWAITEFKANPIKNYIYITPFLKEIPRITSATTPEKRFVEPENKGEGKLFSLNNLLSNEDDIAATHELFKHVNSETYDRIEQSCYTLVLDETLDVISPYEIKSGDLQLLLDGNWISIDEEGYVVWNSEIPEYDSTFEDVKRLAENHSLVCVNSSILLWRYPPEIFQMFNEVYILTYLFEASTLCAYFKYNEIPYTKKTIEKAPDGYQLVPFKIYDASAFKPLINIYEGSLNTNIPQKRSCMSKRWFDNKENKPYIKKLKDNIYNFIRHKCHAKAEDIMWTCFKDQIVQLKGSGYTKSHVPCNCRSTNDYSDKSILVYAVNRYLNPGVPAYFAQKDIHIDNDLVALSEMIQWIWRSRIRNGRPIEIYVASDRMRELLKKWLNGELPECQ